MYSCAAPSIWPHSGWRSSGLPRPRKDSAAASMIAVGEHEGRLDDDRSERVGQHVAEHDGADCLTPSARAASTWSLERWASIEPRSSRAKIGICDDRDGDDDRPLARPRGQRRDRDRQQQRRDREHARRPMRITNESIQPPNAPASDAQRHAADEAEHGGEDADDEGLAAADQQAREHVAAAAVRAEREAGLRAGDGVALWSDLVQEQPGSGVVRGDHGGEDREHDEQQGDRRADEEDGVAAQSAPCARDEGDTGGLVDGAGLAHGTVRHDRADARGARALGELVDPLLLR